MVDVANRGQGIIINQSLTGCDQYHRHGFERAVWVLSCVHLYLKYDTYAREIIWTEVQ
jgi:hypothetical protein